MNGDNLYSEIENLIIIWSNDGTKTKIFDMIPANKIKEISDNIHVNYGDNDDLPPIKPILIVLLIIGMLFLTVCYFSVN